MTSDRADGSHPWLADVPFERLGPVRRALKAALINPIANRFPHSAQRLALRLMGSELAEANWRDPGGWQSMVIAYEGRPPRLVDRVLVGFGTIPMALRNRRRLATRALQRLIEAAPREPVHVFGLGAGPGHTIGDALAASARPAHATLVDLSPDACEHGRRLAAEKGMADRLRFIHGDVRDVATMLDRPPDILEMLGICEYLSDEHVTDITAAVARVMPPGSAIVFNSLSKAHGTNRFFRRVFGLRMIHRTPERLQNLIGAAGFSDFTALPEPLGVYHVVIGRRTA